MRHEIPTHLSVEDRAFYGFSARQVMLVTVGFAGAYALWNQWPTLPFVVRLAVAAACIAVALVLALWRPYGRSLDAWAFVALRYITVPKTTVWRTTPPPIVTSADRNEKWVEWTPGLTWREEAA